MSTQTRPTGRRARLIARLLLIGGVAVFVYSMFSYTAWFWSRGNGVVLQCGRVGVFVSVGKDPGRMPAGLTANRTEPMVSFTPLVLTTAETAFVAGPLWVLGVPAALLLVADAWLIVLARRGLCASCGYSLAGLPEGGPCPECGRVPRPYPRTVVGVARMAFADLGRRTFMTLGAAGAAAIVIGVASGMYGVTLNVSNTRSVALTQGRLEVYRGAGYVRMGAGQRPVPSGKSGPFSCVPLEPMGWRFGAIWPSVKAGSSEVLAIPLWWGAPLALLWPGALRAAGWSVRSIRRAARPVSSVGVTR